MLEAARENLHSPKLIKRAFLGVGGNRSAPKRMYSEAFIVPHGHSGTALVAAFADTVRRTAFEADLKGTSKHPTELTI